MKLYLLATIFVLLNFVACQNNARQNSADSPPESETRRKYAQYFFVKYYADYKEIGVINKWSNDTTFYYLTHKEDVQVPSCGTYIHLPIKDIATTSSTHIGWLSTIDECKCVKGIASPELIYNERIRQLVDNKKIVDIGNAFSPNYEKIILCNPQFVILNDYNGENSVAKKLEELHIPFIFINEWQEDSPLARAEWIKMIASFFDKEDLADSIFTQVEAKYLYEKKQNALISSKKSILTGNCYQGTWHVPGGKSYMAELLSDAGFNYYYATNEQNESIGLSFEDIFLKFHNADVWIGCPADSFNELIASDERYKDFKSVSNKQAYNTKKRCNSSGGNDYWESGVAHPEIILHDLSIIAQGKGDSLYFFQKLE